MDKVRLLYEQTGRSVWMSHLDVMRTLQRALNRAGVPIRYSEGFNPHAQISILMPLSVGTGSLCQMADLRLKEDVDLETLPGRLTEVFPEGLRVLEAYEGGAAPAELKWLAVRGIWEYDDRDPAAAAEEIRALFAGPVDVMRRTKRGEGLFRITDHLRSLTLTPRGGGILVEATLSCNEPVVNPNLLTEALRENCPALVPDGGGFTRTAVFRADGTPFR